MRKESAASGAGRAAVRLHRALLALGADSKVLVRLGAGGIPGVLAPKGARARLWAKVQRRFDRMWTLWNPPVAGRSFSAGWLPDGILGRIRAENPDLLHLHWIADGFVRLETLSRLQCPVVWTLHDTWAFTGGCHYPGNCDRFKSGCGYCPALSRPAAADLSSRGWRRRRAVYGGIEPWFVAPSSWMAETARKSALVEAGRVVQIHNGIDLGVFSPALRDKARSRFGLNPGRRVVLAGATCFEMDPRKGWSLLCDALRRLDGSGTGAGWEFWMFGAGGGAGDIPSGVNLRWLGQIEQEAGLAEVYAAADVFALPSREDNLPNTVVEALACGTPVVAFDVGGLPDMVDTGGNGILVEAFDAEAFAGALRRVLEIPDSGPMRAAARSVAERRFEASAMARAHIELYERVFRAHSDRHGEPPGHGLAI